MIILSRNKWLGFVFSGLLLTAAVPVFAQDSQPSAPAQAQSQHQDHDQAPPPADQSPDAAPQGPAAAGERCWQQAGISGEAMKSRRSITENAKSRMQQVEQDTSLTPQQQRQQIREIRRNAKQQLEKVLTPEQRQDLQQCQRARKPGATIPDSSNPPAPATQPQ